MANALLLPLRVTLAKAPAQRLQHPQPWLHKPPRKMNSTPRPGAPQTWLRLQVPISGIAPSNLQYFSPHLEPDSENKMSKIFLETRFQALAQGHGFAQYKGTSKAGSVHTAMCGHRHPLSSSEMACWKFGFPIFCSPWAHLITPGTV